MLVFGRPRQQRPLARPARQEALVSHLAKARRAAAGDASAGQPELWTFIEFEADEPAAGNFADALAKVLGKEHGRYADFRTPAETFVVYSGRVFRYPRGDGQGRAEAAAYGRSVGVPEHQLDWPA